MKLFHITKRENEQSIRQHGLKCNEKGHLYLVDKSNYTETKFKDKDVVVIEVTIKPTANIYSFFSMTELMTFIKSIKKPDQTMSEAKQLFCKNYDGISYRHNDFTIYEIFNDGVVDVV